MPGYMSNAIFFVAVCVVCVCVCVCVCVSVDHCLFSFVCTKTSWRELGGDK
jgi:hypothetical protein